MVLNLSTFAVLLKNIISKIRRSKFTDYAALMYLFQTLYSSNLNEIFGLINIMSLIYKILIQIANRDSKHSTTEPLRSLNL